ncbi:MAG: hypothetical protein ILP10_03610 [Lachnospiraceae bacterium]|nr:hypothetical protein [Lachnospiraceae bacterium]
MGLFKRKKKENNSAYQWMTVDEALAYSKGEKVVSQASIINAIDETRATLKSIEKQQKEQKNEYAIVTAALADIQKIEAAGQPDRKEILDYASSIIDLKREREKYLKYERKLSEEQYGTFAMYESRIPEQMSQMEENERYMSLINNDIRHLEGEKGSIRYEIEEMEKKQRDLRKFLIAIGIFAVIAFTALIVATEITGLDFTVPFFAAGVAALLAAFYVLFSMRKTTLTLMRDGQKMNRVIMLLNKVKIKYVNCSSALDYAYEKFDVNSYHELAYRWQAYLSEKKEEENQKRNTGMLSSYRSSLARSLARIGVNDPLIWAQQPEPLVDKDALREMSSKYSDRRQKLRAAIEFSNKQINMCNEEIEALISKNPTHEQTIRKLMEDERK